MGLENFEPLKNYENEYLINKNGQIYSCKSKKILKPVILNTGYTQVTLYKNNKSKGYKIHRLVANQYLKKEDNKLVVNHINLDKKDNRLSNLEYVTQKENIKHSKKYGMQQRKKSKDNPKSKKVYQYNLNNELIKIWDSVMDIERELGIQSGCVSNCALNKYKKSKGFIWKYKERGDDLSA